VGLAGAVVCVVVVGVVVCVVVVGVVPDEPELPEELELELELVLGVEVVVVVVEPPEDFFLAAFFFLAGFGADFSAGSEAVPLTVDLMAAEASWSGLVPWPAWAVDPPEPPVALPAPKATANATNTAATAIPI
jgi:hypothetical protein